MEKFIFSLKIDVEFEKVHSLNIIGNDELTPNEMKVYEENNKLCASITLSVDDEDEAKNIARREIQRISFCINTRISHKYCGKIRTLKGEKVIPYKPSITVLAKHIIPIKKNIGLQAWDNGSPLELQLSLWEISQTPDLPISSKINLLFQIIEVTTSDFPKYKNSDSEPDARTECKFLRNLVSHQKPSTPNHDDLKKYCDYLCIPCEWNNPNSKNFQRILNHKIKLMEKTAREAIEQNMK